MNQIVNPVIRDRLKRLNPGRDEEQLVRSFYQKKFKIAGLAIGAGIILGGLLFASDRINGKISQEGEILREGYEGSAMEIPATVHSSRYGEVDVDIVVDHRTYTGEEIDKIFDRAEIWLDQVLPGDNENIASVRDDLVFPAFYEDTDIAIQYTSSNYGLINGNGEVRNEELDKEEQVVIKVEFSYGDAIREREYEITVFPPLLTQTEMFKKTLMETLSHENIRQKENEVFLLPDQVGEENIVFQEKRDKRFLYVICLGILCAAFLYKGMDRDLDKLYEKRKQRLLFCYPEFVSKLALLTGAGMSVTGAVRRIYMDKKDQKEEPLYEELGIFIRELDNGILEERALENLGKRSGLIQYRKFCSLLSANMKKGSVNLKNLLEGEAEEAFTDHQIQIRKLGEEAGTKLLIPMVMMLAVVMVIIMVPAFMTYQIS
ncbi:MAG: type II secretion system F family protein [Lachnospiraceae bacterium]|nr:type II secretion system F family protein [Lachnospiraceae bacterium]